MVGFSKVTNYIFDSLRGSDPSVHQRPPSEMADFLSDAIPGLKINQQEEPGFEVITKVSGVYVNIALLFYQEKCFLMLQKCISIEI